MITIIIIVTFEFYNSQNSKVTMMMIVTPTHGIEGSCSHQIANQGPGKQG
jgi:hypothetical protein